MIASQSNEFYVDIKRPQHSAETENSHWHDSAGIAPSIGYTPSRGKLTKAGQSAKKSIENNNESPSHIYLTVQKVHEKPNTDVR